GVVLLVISAVFPASAPYLAPAGIGLVAGGVIQMLSPQASGLKQSASPDNLPSYAFGSAKNTTASGNPVAICVGERRLRSTNLAKILIAVGEGEFEGVPTAADIFLDNTPINDASGNVNFPNVRWEWRSGSVEQDYIP
nr:hypothetical protein [Tanacetum cinerariifolium]